MEDLGCLNEEPTFWSCRYLKYHFKHVPRYKDEVGATSAKSHPGNELNTRGNIPKRFGPHFPQLHFGEAAQQSTALTARSAPGFPGENDDKWVSSYQAREQLFWFRFSINKKSSESNTLCLLGQQQIPECSGFSLFDKTDKPHPIPTQQGDKILSKEIKQSCCHICEGRHRQDRAVLNCSRGWVWPGNCHCHSSEQGTQNWHQQLHLPLYLVGNLDGLVYLFLYLGVGKHGHLLIESFSPLVSILAVEELCFRVGICLAE